MRARRGRPPRLLKNTDGRNVRSVPNTRRTAPRRLTALALGLWLSGAGCLLCCERTGAGAHAAGTDAVAHAIVAASAEAQEVAPAVSSDHSCCKARVGSRARKAAGDKAATGKARRAASKNAGEQTAPRHPCCRRALRLSEQARKPHADQQPPAHAPSALPRPPRAAPNETFMVARPRAPDRAGTYLRCRVLLI